MLRLPESLAAWGARHFNHVLKREIEGVDSRHLPLQQGLTSSSIALDGPFEFMIISTADDRRFIRVRVGIFYSGVIAGCSCPDDPTPVQPQGEYCEVWLAIDKATAAATIATAAD
jgi:hypothetical protein